MLPRTPPRLRRLTAPALALALIVVSALQAGAVTTYSRTVGSSGHASMYPSGISVDTNGDVYVADTGNDMVKKFLAGTTTPVWTVGVRGQTMQNGSFANPRDVAVGANYVYVADTDNLVVQVLSKQTGAFIQTLPFTFKSPIGVSVGTDSAGHELGRDCGRT